MAVNGLHEKLMGLAEEVGRLKRELAGKLVALGLGVGETPMPMREVTVASEGEISREKFTRILDYWSAKEGGVEGRDDEDPERGVGEDSG